MPVEDIRQHRDAPYDEPSYGSRYWPQREISAERGQQEHDPCSVLDHAVAHVSDTCERGFVSNEAVVVGMVRSSTCVREPHAAKHDEGRGYNDLPGLEGPSINHVQDDDIECTDAEEVAPGHAVELLPVVEEAVGPPEGSTLRWGRASLDLELLCKEHRQHHTAVPDDCQDSKTP
mgnify:CR=1 FL=1